jgi:hypothetical protein
VKSGKEFNIMEDSTSGKVFNRHFVPRRSLRFWKEKPSRTKDYIEFLAHYDAELRQTNGSVAVVRRKTGAELPLEQKGKTVMVKLLLDEFGTVDGANRGIRNYQSSHS